jgi:glutamine amidotransferase
MIAIAAYGVGNVRALANIYQRHGVEARVATEPAALDEATHIILPGVGSFDWAMSKLDSSGLKPSLDDAVLNRRVPVLGICVGMQMLLARSDEGKLPGLGWIPGEVRRMPDEHAGSHLPLPHMGWNDVDVASDPLFAELGDAPSFYFLHSYYVAPADDRFSIATATYGAPFAAAVRRENVAGVQFHPEKSHHWGEKVLLNFARTT